MKGIWRSNPYGSLYWPSVSAMNAEKKLGITDIYYPLLRKDPSTGKYVPNDVEIAPEYRHDINGQSLGYRIYYDVSWDSEVRANSIVAKMDAACTHVGNVAGVMWDIEYHDCSQLVIDVITNWRAIHPKGPIAWTMEPFQAGWMTPELVAKVNADVNMVIVVQNFYGNMTPAGVRNGKDPRQELISKGFASNRVKFFYDAAKSIPSTWDGCILSEETLPSYNLP